MATKSFSFQCPASGDALGVQFDSSKGEWVVILQCELPDDETSDWMATVQRDLEGIDADDTDLVAVTLAGHGVEVDA